MPTRGVRLIRMLVVWALVATRAIAQDPQYANPILAGDYPDPSVIRVGDDFWATATSSEWAPQFPILHSLDLVNWKIEGCVFPTRPTWARGNFWAPEISQYNGRYYVYYVGRNRDGLLAVAVATADKPNGPYQDHGQLVAQEAGSIDPMAFTDQQGQRWLVWKEDGNSRQQAAVLWLQKLSADGLKLIGDRREVIRNDAEWEGQVVEGPFVLFHEGWYYLIYAGAGCCGRGCNYAVGVARTRDINERWEKCPANPILASNSTWRCPGHGSVVEDTQGRFWFIYHAYASDTFVLTGRQMLLDQLTWDSSGWPLTANHGPSVTGASPFRSKQNRLEFRFDDPFVGNDLQPGWLWPQDRPPVHKINNRALELQVPHTVGDDLLGAIVARSTVGGDYRAATIIDTSDTKNATLAGIAAIGDMRNGIGITANCHRALIWQRQDGRQQCPIEVKLTPGPQLHLAVEARGGSQLMFSYSYDGSNWQQLGPGFDGSYMPPWDRNIRVCLTAGGSVDAAARFKDFTFHSVTPAPANPQ